MSIPTIFIPMPGPEEECPVAHLIAWESKDKAIECPVGVMTVLSSQVWSPDPNKSTYMGPEIW